MDFHRVPAENIRDQIFKHLLEKEFIKEGFTLEDLKNSLPFDDNDNIRKGKHHNVYVDNKKKEDTRSSFFYSANKHQDNILFSAIFINLCIDSNIRVRNISYTYESDYKVPVSE